MVAKVLMIDVQKPWDHKNPITVARIENALPHLRKKMEVIWVYMDGNWLDRSPKPTLRRALPGIFNLAAESHAALPRKTERVAFKEDQDAFSNEHLVHYLKSRETTDVYLAGFMTNNCVLSTALGGLHESFNMHLMLPLCADHADTSYDLNLSLPGREKMKIYHAPALENLLR